MGQSKVLYRVGQAVCRPIMKVFYRYKFRSRSKAQTFLYGKAGTF